MHRVVMRVLTALLVLASVGLVCAGPGPSDEILSLPGIAKLPSRMYSGYIEIPNKATLFYWLVESQGNPATDPLVLWQTGGPGCSSLTALLSENGPFWPMGDGSLFLNNATWSKSVNMLYIESPIGVGFSYNNVSNPTYQIGDAATAADIVGTLQEFFKGFPSYVGRDFWVTGESYAGHYVPQITQAVIESNQAVAAGGPGVKINIRGLQVGNAWTFPKEDNTGCASDWWTHSLNSDETYKGIFANCDFSNIGPLLGAKNRAAYTHAMDQCDQYLSISTAEMGKVSIYDIYEDVCNQNDGSRNQVTQLLAALAGELAQNVTTISTAYGQEPMETRYARLQTASRMHAPHTALWAFHLLRQIKTSERDEVSDTPLRSGLRPTVDGFVPSPPAPPCINNYMAQYLNQPAVRQAIHATRPTAAPGNVWNMCSNVVQYSRKDLLTPVIPVYEFLLSYKKQQDPSIRYLVYSGDVDAVVATTGTRNWLRTTGWTVTKPWRPWYSHDQTGGYVVEYDGLTFATTRGAGHMVPGTQPDRSYDLFTRFLNNQPI